MKQEEIDEIVECLPKGKSYFYYFAEKYALMLLAWHTREGRPIRQIRQSNFGRLLDKKAVRSVLSGLGTGILNEDALTIYPEKSECYLLTLDQWGDLQSSRNQASLVLQLNFSSKHNRCYQRLIHAEDRPLECVAHPYNEERSTLSWARIDIDLRDGEALIEEVQTDWIKYALADIKFIRKAKTVKEARCHFERFYGKNANTDYRVFLHYVHQALAPHIRIWAEVTMAATLWFLREELGIRRIFYHTFETGNWLKGMRFWGKPPRSLYTDLPRQFCFQETYNPPSFILRSRRKWTIKELEKLKFFVLEV